MNKLLGISDRENQQTSGSNFIPGDMVKITTGPFSDFDGVVDKISADQQKLTVKVTVFGRETSVEVRADQVEIL